MPGLGLVPYGYAAFLLLFFVARSSPALTNFFWPTVALPYVLSLRRAVLSRAARSRVFLAAFALLSYCYASLAWSEGVLPEDWFAVGVSLLCLLVFVDTAIEISARDPRFLERLYPGIVLTASALALWSILNFYVVSPWATGALPYADGRLRYAGVVEHHVLGACVFGSVSLLAAFSSSRWSWPNPIWGRALAAFLAASVVLTQSRGPILALAGTLVVGLAAGHRGLAAALVGLVGLGAALRVGAGPSTWLSRADHYRLEAWAQAWDQIRAAPFVGHGMLTPFRYRISAGWDLSHPHSIFIWTQLAGGLVGTLLLAALVATAAHAALARWRDQGDFTLAALLLFALGAGATDSHLLLTRPQPIWFFFWLPVALCAASEAER